jgi:hypothetical protein
VKPLGLVAAALFPALLGACAGGAQGPRAGHGSGDLTAAFEEAFRVEANGDPKEAEALYMTALRRAAASPGDPWQLPVVLGALDALVVRSIPALDDATEDAAIAFRVKDAPALGPLAGADDPFVPGLVARALVDLAERRGDARETEAWRQRTGCAREATVIGPLSWAPVTGAMEADPLARFDAKLEATYPAAGAVAPPRAPVVVRGRGCAIDLTATSAAPGTRDVAIDFEIKRAQPIGLTLRARGAAVLRAGGKTVFQRPYELGGGEAALFARVDAPAGRLRVVVRVGLDEDGETLEVDALDEHGAPLPAHAPHVGEAANARVTTSSVVETPAPRTDAERLTAAAAALAVGAAPIAERLVEREGSAPNSAPALALVYARAVEGARDLSAVHRGERARAAYERVLDVWPTAWEAIVAHAVLAGVRRGQTEARIETLKDLDGYRSKAGPFALPILDAFDAAVSGKDDLWGRAREAYERASKALDGTALLVDAGRFAFERSGKERVAYACNPDPPHDRSSLECYDARRATGDFAGAARELERIRLVLGGPDLFLPLSLRDALTTRDRTAAERAIADMLPGEVTLSSLYATALLRFGHTDKRDRAALFEAASTARDAPSALMPLLHAMGDEPTAAFAGIADAIAARDRANPVLPTAATAILSHRERYDVEASGVAHAVLFDVRRVGGTTDVEENAQADAPMLAGRSVMRIVRRRIFKNDGRVVEPERAPNAQQSHTELSQLEAGDIIEAIYEGWATPDDQGDLGVDSPDMLPERTAVHDAAIELRLPAGLRGSLWSHPLLGPGAETKEEGRRVLRWTMKDVPVRHIEEGTPKMDRTVSVSFSTAEWSDVSRALKETLAALDEHAPEVARWATEAAAGAKGPSARAKIDAVNDAAGVAVKESSTALLCDIGLGRETGPQATTARTILTNHEGSRTWLVVRALRELGIRADVVIAENEPYSADPTFPPHSGRFMHPLAIAWAEGAPVWIDADVAGPPLPAGRISPELRGRNVLHADGTISRVPNTGSDDERDEIDIRLVLDAKGDAKGTFTAVLRGRDAQEIAEALFRIVGDERQRALRGVALSWIPFANVDHVALSSREGSWEIAVRAEVSVGAYAQAEGSGAARTWVLPGIDPLHQVYPRASTGTLGATYVSEGQRESALAVSRAVQFHVHRRVDLPLGTTPVRTPGPFGVKSANLEASRRIAVSGTVVEDDFELGVPTGTVSADEYAGFVADAHHTDDAFLASTRVKPPK